MILSAPAVEEQEGHHQELVDIREFYVKPELVELEDESFFGPEFPFRSPLHRLSWSLFLLSLSLAHFTRQCVGKRFVKRLTWADGSIMCCGNYWVRSFVSPYLCHFWGHGSCALLLPTS
ncbi:hypothetical protein BT93_F3344 [Corymbia citriodora subsp. variegata]|nr:hypothetical protein BT93_F3344 [Corymbia citriodora subsp. variegata]